MAHLYSEVDEISPYIKARKKFYEPKEWDNMVSALKTSTTLYVGNLSFYTEEEQIYALFSMCGPVRRIIMGIHKYDKTPCGFCFVEYYFHKDAMAARYYINGTKLDERLIRVDIDPGFENGRQYGRGQSGGQVRDDRRSEYDEGRGGLPPRQKRRVEEKAYESGVSAVPPTHHQTIPSNSGININSNLQTHTHHYGHSGHNNNYNRYENYHRGSGNNNNNINNMNNNNNNMNNNGNRGYGRHNRYNNRNYDNRGDGRNHNYRSGPGTSYQRSRSKGGHGGDRDRGYNSHSHHYQTQGNYSNDNGQIMIPSNPNAPSVVIHGLPPVGGTAIGTGGGTGASANISASAGASGSVGNDPSGSGNATGPGVIQINVGGSSGPSGSSGASGASGNSDFGVKF